MITLFLILRRDGYSGSVTIAIGLVVAGRVVDKPLTDDIVDDEVHRLNVEENTSQGYQALAANVVAAIESKLAK